MRRGLAAVAAWLSGMLLALGLLLMLAAIWIRGGGYDER